MNILDPGFPYINNGFITSFHPFHYGGKRKRRHRTIFSEEQLQILENAFQGTHYPDVMLREKLAVQCDLKEERVEVKEILVGKFLQTFFIVFFKIFF